MKRFVIIVSVLVMMASMIFADDHLIYGKPEGDWMIRSGCLYQNDVDASRAKAWRMSDSWLLWLNYDESPINPSIPQGLSAQLYKSTSDSDMEVVQSISLRAIESIAVQYLNSDIPVKSTYMLGNGRITISDPRSNTGGFIIHGARYHKDSF